MTQRGVICKPQSQFLLKESNFDHVLVNLSNRHNLTRNEHELAANIFIQDSETQQTLSKAKPSEKLIRKLNIATLKYRPVCAFSGVKCGLRWFEIDGKPFSETCYLAGSVKGENVE